MPRAIIKLVPYLASRFYAKPHWCHIHSTIHHNYSANIVTSHPQLGERLIYVGIRLLSCLLKEVTDVRFQLSLSSAFPVVLGLV